MKRGLVLLAIVALASVLAVSTAYRTDPATAKGVVVKLGNRQTNRLTRLGTSGPVVPMQGNLTFWAEFFVEIGLGTPPQKMLVDIDTGMFPPTVPSFFSLFGPLFLLKLPSALLPKFQIMLPM